MEKKDQKSRPSETRSEGKRPYEAPSIRTEPATERFALEGSCGGVPSDLVSPCINL